METRLEMVTELSSRLQVASNSTLYPTSRLNTLINQAYIWATDMFIWQELVKALQTTAVADQEYYDYPTTFRTGTIHRLTLNGTSYNQINFEDYKKEGEEDNYSDEKVFGSFGRQYFISPIEAGTIVIWGAIQATTLSADSDKTIFSLGNREGNEAIVKKAHAVAVGSSNTNLSVAEEAGAVQILSRLNKSQKTATQRHHHMNRPMFNVPDFFASSNNSTRIGNF